MSHQIAQVQAKSTWWWLVLIFLGAPLRGFYILWEKRRDLREVPYSAAFVIVWWVAAIVLDYCAYRFAGANKWWLLGLIPHVILGILLVLGERDENESD